MRCLARLVFGGILLALGTIPIALYAPFDAIMVTAAPKVIPPPLIAQLKPGGRLVMPLEGAFGRQSLMVIEKGADGRIVRRTIIAVRFVPLTRNRR